jgi:YNFM family putative membrane transporter
MVAGMAIAGLGILISLIAVIPAIALGTIVLCLGMFTAQSTAPAYVQATAETAKGGASALYLTFYYLGATLGSFLPGLAWQAYGWAGVVACCIAALVLGILAAYGCASRGFLS